MDTLKSVTGMSEKLPWHTPNVYVLRGSGTEKPRAPSEGLFKQPSSHEHPDAGDPLGFPHGPVDDVVGPS